ncbi:MAG: 1-(5-phosphoribosyl)-5-[(5-phosphoribosylamino)methylideneamino] imidazole-4-carboxamide isomerase [Deltaproteobacteria bacterium]|nr:1-(5-phosphoribosyl)-5-[(5-phosphoribosylamino)methylideneamino] imidazole-4-carboxamide isomerase [Deltaproteobacteria bacterium]MBK8234892.1 1-(5-phosphoribosyl)-5-[(5-phosphoribosylamino)methylideneamino] imidazole-4-carboxamide isomerase [Deltaproteobacteria bacterium]MBK8719788.1 1-(5-phosphoribosyl)-5-[(5-phosphoribosylamino)methylideneamino] imidazole-4-carboxamide isomerase [Deltaproteobacteria bacterium]MBP7285236.1 1-(5-phosphoribosyl)-5-[(5-phosphoribosylamino)methylideneamino] imi
MRVIPAIDLLQGHAVRLAQGDRSRATRYEASPVQMVDRFADAGVQLVHVVDLDGAFGEPLQRPALAEIVARAHARGVQIELGGGLRDADAVERALATGADFAVVGTLALRDPQTCAALCERHRDRIVVAADANDGMVAIDGWREASQRTAAALVRDAAGWGAAAVLYTDIGRDGLQTGPAVAATAALQALVEIPIYASGGVGSLADLTACRDAGLRGVVVGRALYENSFSIEEAMARC